jgi:hypothetical protein
LRDTQPDTGLDSGKVLPPLLGLVVIALLAVGMWSLGLTDGGLVDDLARCSALTESSARLACYDRIAAPKQPAKGAFAIVHPRPREDVK